MAELRNLLACLACLVTLQGATWAAPERGLDRVRRSDGAIRPFVINGKDAKQNQFPEVVSLQLQANIHICGGAIIAKNWILTAAHCVENLTPKQLTMIAGTKDHYGIGGKRLRAKKIIKHEDYHVIEGGALVHDIALIQTEEPIQLSKEIRLATLQRRATKTGDPVVVAGWGKTEHDNDETSRMLQYVKQKVVSHEDCSEAYKNDTRILDDQICVSSEGDQGECKGDSGGPLFSNGRVVGVVSWSKKPCGTHPGVYSSVHAHRDWLKEKTGLSNLL